jgi:hypothetical protein
VQEHDGRRVAGLRSDPAVFKLMSENFERRQRGAGQAALLSTHVVMHRRF